MLQQRAAKEVSAEQALGQARNEYNRRMALLEDSRRRLDAVLSNASVNEVDVFEVMYLSLYRMSLSGKIDSQENDVNEAGLLVEDKRGEAIQARQERQVIEKLKDKRMREYMRESAMKEQKEVDEQALYTYQRRMSRI
ncbi:MAG: Flagellar FliJ protein [Pelotomaculum sp. PtaU1.Bin035]|nr:MAG: Flagellar FliJ protein [Pelotomaculum sp. PtaU1.Bin035]